MKISTLLFSLYIALIACYPCMDKDNGGDVQQYGYELSNIDGHSHAGDADLCSPFCSCSCCSITIQLVVTSVVVPVCIHDYITIQTPYLEKVWVSSTYSIWQPPKLA